MKLIDKINCDGTVHTQINLLEEDLKKYVVDLNEEQFNDIPSEVRNSFEFGVYFLKEASDRIMQQQKLSDYVDLYTVIPTYEDSGNLPFWISELIQNANDAKWGKDGIGHGASKFTFIIDSEKLVFSHNGRPPQFVDYATNEISKMTKHSTSKAKQYATEGEFGIGFKIWMRLFGKIRLSYGKCALVIDISDGKYPSYDVQWNDDDIVREFTIEAFEPKENVLDDFLLESDGVNQLFERSIKGMLVKPKEFEISINLPNQPEISICKNIGSESSIDGMQAWTIEGDSDIFHCPKNVLTYTKKIGNSIIPKMKSRRILGRR